MHREAKGIHRNPFGLQTSREVGPKFFFGLAENLFVFLGFNNKKWGDDESTKKGGCIVFVWRSFFFCFSIWVLGGKEKMKWKKKIGAASSVCLRIVSVHQKLDGTLPTDPVQ